MNTIKTKKRNSNIEILRIMSMLFIIAHHLSLYGFKNVDNGLSYNHYINGILNQGGKLGVICFVMISAFYMVDSEFTFRKLLKIYGEVWFYSVGILVLFLLLKKHEFVYDDYQFFLPFTFIKYGFITRFICLMCISPILNKTIEITSKKNLIYLIAFLVLIWSILPILFEVHVLQFTEMIWFITLYFIGGCIKKYADFEKHNSKIHLCIAIIAYIFILLFNPILKFNTQLCVVNSPLILITGIELLIAFSKCDYFCNKTINEIASTTLGIFLIHEHPLMRRIFVDYSCKKSKIIFY